MRRARNKRGRGSEAGPEHAAGGAARNLSEGVELASLAEEVAAEHEGAERAHVLERGRHLGHGGDVEAVAEVEGRERRAHQLLAQRRDSVQRRDRVRAPRRLLRRQRVARHVQRAEPRHLRQPRAERRPRLAPAALSTPRALSCGRAWGVAYRGGPGLLALLELREVQSGASRARGHRASRGVAEGLGGVTKLSHVAAGHEAFTRGRWATWFRAQPGEAGQPGEQRAALACRQDALVAAPAALIVRACEGHDSAPLDGVAPQAQVLRPRPPPRWRLLLWGIRARGRGRETSRADMRARAGPSASSAAPVSMHRERSSSLAPRAPRGVSGKQGERGRVKCTCS